MPSAGSHDFSILSDAIVFLLAAVAVVTLARRIGVNAVLGYIVAGLIVGPHGLALIGEVEGTHRLAELGIVFMLFAIGLEMSFDRLKVMARYIFGLGAAQMALTGTAIGACAAMFGAGWGQAVVIGGALAVSSTAFVLQMLSERGELSSQLGRVALSVLLLQDLAVVPGLAIVAALGQDPERLMDGLLLAGAKATGALVILLVVGRLLLRPLFRTIAASRSPEMFVATTLLVVLGTAWGTEAAGLSMALGAFLAGLMLAATEYRHQIESDIRPFRALLLGLFFMSVGMLVDLEQVLPRIHLVLAATVALVAGKALILLGLGRLFGLPLPLATSAAFHLAQGGEFAFVLFSLAMATVVLPSATGHFLIAVVALSMGATPLLAGAGRRSADWIRRHGSNGRSALVDPHEARAGHVVIAGYGRVGQTIARVLDELGWSWVAVDRDAERVEASRRSGLPVFYGDAAQETLLAAADIDTARGLVVTLDDPSAAHLVLQTARRRLSDLPIIVRARDERHMRELDLGGATTVQPETTEASLLLGSAVLSLLGESDARSEMAIANVRRSIREASRPSSTGEGDA